MTIVRRSLVERMRGACFFITAIEVQDKYGADALESPMKALH